jgi:tetratricopeptide (TPR) repeat protein
VVAAGGGVAEAVSRRGADRPWLVRLGRVLLLQKKYADAEPPLRECLAIFEKDKDELWLSQARSLLGGSLLGQKKYGDAEPLLLQGYEGLARKDKDSTFPMAFLPEALERLMQLYEETDRPEKAAEWRKKLIEMLKRMIRAAWRDHLAEADAAARRLVALCPTDPVAHYWLGVILSRRNVLGEAESEYREALRLREDYAAAHEGLGIVFARTGRWDVAVSAFRRSLGLDPRNKETWERFAALLLYTGDVKEYRSARRELLERFGKTDQPPSAGSLAWTCLTSPEPAGDLGPLLEVARRVEDGDEIQAWHDNVRRLQGLAAYRAGRFTDALEKLKECSPDPDGGRADAAIFTELALAHHRLGQAEEARAALSKARAILEKTMPNPEKGRPYGDDWHLWLLCQVLFREAERLLKGPDAKPPAGKD